VEDLRAFINLDEEERLSKKAVGYLKSFKRPLDFREGERASQLRKKSPSPSLEKGSPSGSARKSELQAEKIKKLNLKKQKEKVL